MSQKTREKYGIRLPVMVDVGRGTGLTAAARSEFACEVEVAASAHKFDSFMIPAARKPEPVWNGLRRLWMVDGVAVDPQPVAPPAPLAVLEMVPGARGPVPAPPSVSVEVSLDSGRHYGPAASLPPSVKVSA